MSIREVEKKILGYRVSDIVKFLGLVITGLSLLISGVSFTVHTLDGIETRMRLRTQADSLAHEDFRATLQRVENATGKISEKLDNISVEVATQNGVIYGSRRLTTDCDTPKLNFTTANN